MTDQARIKLAEAMGCPIDEFGRVYIRNHWHPFRPFADANDDYAVLQWVRGGSSPVELWMMARRLGEVMRGRGGFTAAIDYQVGDYSRAACAALGIEVDPYDE